MKLTNIAIALAIAERDWEAAIRLLASLFELDDISDAIAKHGVSMSTAPSWEEEAVEIRWKNRIYCWKNHREHTVSYPVYYPTPLAIIYYKGLT